MNLLSSSYPSSSRHPVAPPSRRRRPRCRPLSRVIGTESACHCKMLRGWSMKQFGFVLVSLASLLASAGAAIAADAALVEAAKKEGRVTWYTVQIADQIVRPIISGFERTYGIRVDFVRANSAQVALRLSNEAKAGQVRASVFDGTGATVALKRENLVEKW